MKTGRGHWNRAEKGKSRHNMIPICHNHSLASAHDAHTNKPDAHTNHTNHTSHANHTNKTDAERLFAVSKRDLYDGTSNSLFVALTGVALVAAVALAVML